MSELKTRHQRPVIADPDRVRDDWTHILQELIATIHGWLARGEWSSRMIEKDMDDSILGEYQAPALLLQRDFTRIMVEPIARFAPGTDGVVDVYKMPAYAEIANLYRIEEGWKIHYAFRPSQGVAHVGEGESLDLNERNFLQVLDEIAGHAAS